MNIQDMMRQAQQLQQQVEAARAEAAKKTAEGTAGGGMVKVVATGEGLLRSVQIEPEVVNPDELELLQDLVLLAANQAIGRAKELMERDLQQVAGGALQGLPGLF